MRVFSSSRMALILIGAILGAAVATAVTVNAHGGDSGLIHSCVKNGDLRIVEPSEACKANETALDWGIQGPPGDPGTSGATPAVVFNEDTECTITTSPGICLSGTLPPGTWLLDYRGHFGGPINVLTSQARPTCQLLVGDEVVDEVQTGWTGHGTVLSLKGAVSLDSGEQLQLECVAGGTGASSLINQTASALAVVLGN